MLQGFVSKAMNASKGNPRKGPQNFRATAQFPLALYLELEY